MSGLSSAEGLRKKGTWRYARQMKDITSANFGLLIAYVLPGFVLLGGIEPYSETVQAWVGQSSAEAASVGGFLYVTVASVGLGQLVSTLRWLTIDSLHHRTGIGKPSWNFRRLKDKVEAFDHLIQIHYRYYQWHANSLISVTLAAFLRWTVNGFRWKEFALVVTVNCLLYAGSRDTLDKYYRRVEELLGR
ncbi:MAG: hypothetical protein GY758_32330 [Fuerstiella sp.]|nr:hypothetical protein [Fuerstiella sp.]